MAGEKVIDEKDRKILAQLDVNARQTDSEISKKVRLSKQVVNYRIQKLIERGIIHNFYSVINVGKLGLDFYYVFIQLENVNKQQERSLLKRLNGLDYVGWLVSGMGRWDVVIGVNTDSVVGFDQRLNKIINICGNYLHDYMFTTMIGAQHLKYKFLNNEERSIRINQEYGNKISILDSSDKKILKEISQNARLPITEISDRSKIPLHVVNYHLKNLVKNKIIEGFKPKLDIGKLGYQWHLLLIKFGRATEDRRKDFIRYCENHSKVYYVTNTIGSYNVMLDVHVGDVEEFKEFLLEIKDKFSDIVRVYESMIIFEEHKIDYVPKIILE